MTSFEIMQHNVALFQMKYPGKPEFDAITAEEKTLGKILESMVDFRTVVNPCGSGEFYGLKIYVENDVPPNKARLKLRGVTVGEMFAFRNGNEEAY